MLALRVHNLDSADLHALADADSLLLRLSLLFKTLVLELLLLRTLLFLLLLDSYLLLPYNMNRRASVQQSNCKVLYFKGLTLRDKWL